MRKKIWVSLCLIFMECYLAMAWAVQGKEDAEIPVTTLSPPEGNTTFLGGKTWRVALAGASQSDLQNALDWACGLGMADCSAIQEGGSCFEPETVVSHASYAFNNYYPQNGNSDIACNFGRTAAITKHDPSYGKCVYATSGSVGSSAPPLIGRHSQSFMRWKLAALLLLSYIGIVVG